MSNLRTRQQQVSRCTFAGIIALWATAAASPVFAALSAEELAKLAQNPIANLISVPFQNNTNFNVGPQNGTQNILNIQPVIPFHVNADWNVITRTIVPVISQPAMTPSDDRTNGIGDVQLSAFLSPASAAGTIWGVGAIAQLPTHTDDALGNERWGLGPTAVVLRLEKGSPWVYGVLANNVWSVSSSPSSPPTTTSSIQITARTGSCASRCSSCSRSEFTLTSQSVTN